MKHLYQTITSHVRQYFFLPSHLLVLLFLAVLLTINYNIGFEKVIIFKQSPKAMWPVLFFITYSVVYGGSLLIMHLSGDKLTIKHPKKFFLFNVLFLLLLALHIGFPLNLEVAKWLNPLPENSRIFYYTFRIWVQIKSSLLFLIPGVLFYSISRWGAAKNYGLNQNTDNTQHYFFLILLMLPLLIAASFLPDFQKSYPRYRDYHEYVELGVHQWQTIGFYELSYGFSFLTIEFIMRGVFVLGSAYFIGPKAILPMAALYVSIHFGKPLGEAISSFFGGYILGILAYYSKNIYGGVITHLGIAWIMELLAFWQLYGR